MSRFIIISCLCALAGGLFGCVEGDPEGSRDDFADAGQTIDTAIVDTGFDAGGVPDIGVTGCTDDSHCEPDGVCDKDTGKCVDCRTDQDCPQSAFCIEGQCIPDICQPGATRCYGRPKVAMCKANGGGWNLSDCPADTFCEKGKCVPFVCKPGSRVCESTNVMKCDEFGAEYTHVEDCAKTDQACVGGKCIEKGCTAGTVQCTKGASADTALICKDPKKGIEAQPCADKDPCTYDLCKPGVGCANPPKPDGIACGAGKWCYAGTCTMRTSNLAIIFDTSGSMAFNVPGKLCWKQKWPKCLPPHKQCSRMGVSKNVFTKALAHINIAQTRMAMFRFPQLVLDPKKTTSPKPPYFKPPEVTCKIGHYMGYQDMTDHTKEQSVGPTSTWYWKNLNEILCVPFPKTDKDNPKIEMARWMDGKETYLEEPEFRAIGGTPIGKTLFYVGEYLRNVVVIDGKTCKADADCGNPNYVCKDAKCHDPMRACRDTTVVIFTDGGEVNKPNQFFSPWVQAKRLAYGLHCKQDHDCVGGAKCLCPPDKPQCKPQFKRCTPEVEGSGFYCRTTMQPCLPEAAKGAIGYCPPLSGFDACVADPIGDVTAKSVDFNHNVLRSPDGEPFAVRVHVVDISEQPWGIEKSANIARSGNGLLLASKGQDEDTFLKHLLTAFDVGPKPACGAKNVTCSGKPGECDDGDPCTKDSCNAITKTCVHIASNGPCDDGKPCTLGERCLGGKCKAGIVHVTTKAGGGKTQIIDGKASEAGFHEPRAITSDGDGGLFISDFHMVRHMSSAGDVTFVAGHHTPGLVDGPVKDARFSQLMGMDWDESGKQLFVADRNTHRIRRVKDGKVTTAAGFFKGYLEGPAAAARFTYPEDVIAAPTGGDITLFVADRGNRRIRQVSPQGNVSTLVGTGIAGLIDGPAATARLGSPGAIAIGIDGALYIADSHRVRKFKKGLLTTIAGGDVGFKNGVGDQARFSGMSGIAIAVDGTIYIADGLNNRIRKVTQGGAVTTVAGGPQSGFQDGFGQVARFANLGKIELVDGGKIIAADTKNWRLRQIQLPEVACPVGGECNESFCDAKTGKCATKPAADGKPCAGELCTEDQTCLSLKCAGGKPMDCNDNDVCTDDSCEAKQGGCVHKANTAACDDGEPCTEKDVCAAGKCVGTAMDCDDNNPNTTGVCYLGKCYQQPTACSSDLECSDGESACTIETCVKGKCVNTPTGSAGCCNAQPWANSFDKIDLLGIKVSNSAGADKGWRLWTKPDNPPLSALYYGDPKAGNYAFNGPSKGTFTTPEVKLPAGRKSHLSMWLWMDTEGGRLYDALRIEVISAKNTTLLWEKTAAMPLASWQKLKFDLAKWQGESVRVRVTFDTVDEIDNERFGVLVDNLSFDVACK